MRNNFSSLIKQEMVNRFENVVKEEIYKNQISISETSKSLESMRRDIDSFKNEYEKLRNTNQDSYIRLASQFSNEKDNLERRFKDHIDSTFRNIQSFSQTLEGLFRKFDGYIAKDVHESQKLEEKKKVNELFEGLRNDLNETQSNFKRLCQELTDKNKEFCNKVIAEQSKLLKKLSEVDVKLEEYKVEFLGLLKEVRIYKKENFIFHKEIENIYTLIERLEKRIEP